jgi:hypothetical protein
MAAHGRIHPHDVDIHRQFDRYLHAITCSDHVHVIFPDVDTHQRNQLIVALSSHKVFARLNTFFYKRYLAPKEII